MLANLLKWSWARKESAAIMVYLAEKLNCDEFYPTDPRRTAELCATFPRALSVSLYGNFKVSFRCFCPHEKQTHLGFKFTTKGNPPFF